MTKTAKIFYWVASILYVLATIYEIYIYMSMESNYVGIIYLFLSFFVMFLMLTVSYNYDRASVKHRISKNIIAISVGLFSSYIISLILPHVMGYEDASRMFIMRKTTPEKEQLVRVAKECLEIGAEAAKPYGFVGDIGHAIQKHVEKYHYGIVRDLCGHGVGIQFHEEPEVAHYGHRGQGMLLVPGMVFTIEPMINQGTWKVFIDADDKYGWEVITGDELPSAQWEHTFLMTEHGLEILSH